MAIQGKVGLERQAGIDTGYDYVFERRWSKFERAAWLTMVLLVAAGLAGVFGRGPVNKMERKMPDGTSVEYERVVRFKTPSSVNLTLPVVNGKATLEIMDKAAAVKLGLQSVFPAATQNLASTGVGPLVFQAPDPQAKQVFVQLGLQSGGMGPVISTYRVNGTTTFQLSQFMVP